MVQLKPGDVHIMATATDAGEQRPPTLADIAERAGVSLKTASRAVNGEKYVAAATRDRVLAVAESMGFQLNAVASQLKRGVQSRAIGLITGDLANPFYSMLAKGVEREIRQQGLQLTIASSEESPQSESELVEEFVVRRVRGLIVVSTMPSHEAFASVVDRGIPVVFVDRGPVGVVADSIVIDNYAGARGAAEQLLGLGHRRIGYVSHFARLQPQREREQGFEDAMTAAGIANWREFVVEGVADIERSAAAVTELLAREPRPTAIITGNNRITIGALRAIAHCAPETALIGFDDFDLADVLGVSTVSHDPAEMGRMAAQQVLAAATARGSEPRRTVMPVRIVQRGSGERRPVG
jgi:LacI family transcriptional regulator